MKMIKEIANRKGYKNHVDFLRDYGFVPSVLMRKRKKREIIPVIFQYLKDKVTNR